MIYLIGDLHGEFDRLYELAASFEGEPMTKSDYVIILGDVEICEANADRLRRLDKELPFTVLFIDGNHEDFNYLQKFPEKILFGARVRDVFGLYHIGRGEILALPTEDGIITVAALGGGDSRDRESRTEGVDWFAEETVTDADVSRLLQNAERYGMKVDYFISHSLSSAVKEEWNYELRAERQTKPPYPVLPSDYKIRDAIASLDARVYFSAHEHIDRGFCLGTREYQSVYRDFIKIQKI